jgi:hypothetical protein
MSRERAQGAGNSVYNSNPYIVTIRMGFMHARRPHLCSEASVAGGRTIE